MDPLPTDDVRLHLVAHAVRRRWPAIVVTALVLTVLMGAFVLLRPPAYNATGNLLLRPIIGNALAPTSTSSKQITVSMETEANLVSSADVVKRAGGNLDPARITTSIPANSQVLSVSYAAASPDAATAAVTKLMNAYLDYRHDQASAARKAESANLDKQITTTKKNLAKATDDSTAYGAKSDTVVAVQLYSNRLATLRDALGNIEAASTDGGSIVTPATVGTRSTVVTLLLVGSALVGGLMLGFLIAVLRERADDRVRAEAESSIAGVPILTRLAAHADTTDSVAQLAADDAVQEAYRRLRAATMLAAERPHVLSVAPLDDDGYVADVAVNLALSLNHAGYRVTVVETRRDDSIGALLEEVDDSWGVTDVLAGRRRIAEIAADAEGLRAIGAGRSTPSTRELFAGEAFATMVDDLRREDDYVVIAAPPVGTPDGTGVFLAVDGVAVVIEDETTTHAEVADLARRADQFGVPLHGVIVRPEPADQRRGRHHPARATATAAAG